MGKLNIFIQKYGIVFWIIPFVLAAIGTVFPMSLSIKPSLGFAGAIGAIGAMFIVVLLVERVTEIIIKSRREEKSKLLEQELEILKTDLSSILDDESKLKNKMILREKQHELDIYKMQTARHAIFFAFSISVFAAISGIGLLNEIFTIPDGSADYQKPIFRLVDILLTAGLIAGGTTAFHELFSAAETFSAKLRPSSVTSPENTANKSG